jgi:very-short-patch-repair endonuclease
MDAVEELLARQGGMARRRQLRKAGMSRRQLQAAVDAGRFRLLTPGLYVTADRGPDELLRAAVVRLDAVVSDQSAALLWGIELSHTPEQPHVLVARNRGGAEHEGVRVHRVDLREGESEPLGTVNVTTVLRTLLDLSRRLPVEQAVAAVDSALRQGLITTEELVGGLCALPAGRGRQRVCRVLDLIDPKSGSVLESLCRVLLALNGLPAPQTQHVVRSAGRWVGRVDFAWLDQWLIVETDGFEYHKDRASYRKDRRRLNALQLAGWTVLRFSWEDVVHDPDYVVRSVAGAIALREAA